MSLSEMVRQAIRYKGMTTLSQAAKRTGVSTECLRLFLNKKNGIPKDNTLLKIAKGLGLDQNAVLVAAHRERLSEFGEDNLLQPTTSAYGQKRVWPLSQEQCQYLGRYLSDAEIQLIRKYRQVSPEGRVQTRGYIDYMYKLHREAPHEGSVA